jgi:ADP-ribose pyrophosphatase YjhB (NUDIX family)
VSREVCEESGIEVEVQKLAAVYDRDQHGHPPIPFYVYKLFFLCRSIGGVLTHSSETEEAKYFPVQDLPELSQSRVTEKQIRRLYEHHLDLSLPTDFD